MPETGRAPGALAWSGTSDKRSYYRLFSAYVMALVATGVVTVALAIFAFDLAEDDPSAVIGTALSLKMLAYVIASPVAAALVERLPRKPLLIALDLVRAACLFLLPFVQVVWQVYALVFAFALASATFTLVYQTVVPYLLGSPEDYSQSLARSRIASEVDSSISPLLGAGLLLALSPAGVFVAATLAFVGSAVLVNTADLPRTTAVLPHGVWGKVLRGPRQFLARPELRGLLALDVAVALVTAMVMVNTVVLIEDTLGLQRRATAVAFAVFGLGSIAGALAMPWMLRWLPDRPVMFAGAGLMVAGMLAGSLVTTSGGLTLVWLVLGLGAALTLTPASFLIRRIASPADLQTLFAAQFSISNACLLVGYSAAGWLGATLGMTATFLTLAAGAALATLVAARIWPREEARG